MIQGKQISQKQRLIPSLDGLRGLAALNVYLSHTGNHKMFLIPGLDFAGSGKCALYLFFVLSSFLLTIPFLQNPEKIYTKRGMAMYFLRRGLRIYPIYLIYLALAFVVTAVLKLAKLNINWALPFSLNMHELLAQIFLVYGKGVTWSIIVEGHYYFILPIISGIFIYLFRRSILLCTVATVGCMSAIQHLFREQHSVNHASVFFFVPVFLVGALTAIYTMKWQKSSLSESKATKVALDVLACAVSIFLFAMVPAISSMILGMPVDPTQYHDKLILFATLWGIFIFCLLNGAGLFRRALENPVLTTMGHISFSFYLFHIVSLDLMSRTGFASSIPCAQPWIALLATAAVSYWTYTKIELPASKLAFAEKLMSIFANLMPKSRIVRVADVLPQSESIELATASQ